MAKAKKKPTEGLTRNAIALKLGMALSQVQSLLARPDAPKAKAGRYVLKEAEAFIQANTKWARAGLSEEARTMKDEMIALDLEEKRAAAALRRGEIINKKAVVDSIVSLTVDHFAMVKQKFVDELPSKYIGKNEVECRMLNESAYNEIAEAFRAGTKRIENKMGGTSAA